MAEKEVVAKEAVKGMRLMDSSRVTVLEIQVGGSDAKVKVTLRETAGASRIEGDVCRTTPWDLGGLFWGTVLGLIWGMKRR